MEYIRWFEEIRHSDIALVGGKGANLGEMVSAGLPVPPGFCLTASAYRDFITAADQEEIIQRWLDKIEIDDPGDVEIKTREIRTFIRSQEMPPEIEHQVRHNYARLTQTYYGSGNQETQVPVAVRSSATAEDLPTASFAGQQDTYLNICGEDALVEHVKRCWASLWTARAVTYRNRQGFDHQKVNLSVVVQVMVPAEVSGIMFTVDPVSGCRDSVVINASWGLGEAIVSGLVSPDTFTVDKKGKVVIKKQIAAKTHRMEYAEEGGIITLENHPERQLISTLEDEQVCQLAELGSSIEAHYGAPQDIEWACAQGNTYVLQSRPITTLSDTAAETQADPTLPPVEYNRTMFVEIFPDPLSPVFGSAVQPLFHSMLDFTFQAWGFSPPENGPAVELFYNQPYFNRQYIEAAFAPLTPPVRNALVAQIMNPFGDKKGDHREISAAYLRMVARMLRFMVRFPKQMPVLVARYQAEVAEISRLVPEQCTDAALVKAIHELLFDSTRRLIDYDFLLIAVVKRVYALIESLLVPYFGDQAEGLRNTLVSGVSGNVTMETNIQIWDLAQFAKGSPEVVALLEKHPGITVLAHLEQITDGRAFLEELTKFLRQYGHREVRLDIVYPTWSEDPAPVLNFIRGYLHVGREQDPRCQLAQLAVQRTAARDKVHKRLKKDLKGRLLVWPAVHWLLEHIEFHTRERDTMHFEMTRVFPPFRRLLMVLGNRWSVRGLLNQPDDIYFLTLDEMMQVAETPARMIELTQKRRMAFEANKQRPWPNIIRGDEEIYPEGIQANPQEGNQLQGVAGSPGKAVGLARVIRGPEDFHRLQKGEILVAPLTNPVWTPLFAIAGGIITEVGGILSHGAIVAREYGIPAVMSVPGATRQIQDGTWIRLDGSRGIVAVESETDLVAA